ERKFAVRNLTAFVFVLLVALTVPSRVQSTVMPNTRPPGPALAIPSASEPTPREGVWERTLNQINRRRAAFQNYEGGRGSSIDTGARLASAGDLLMYLPRAISIGL